MFRIFRRQPVISKTTKNDVESIPETNLVIINIYSNNPIIPELL